MDVQELIKRYKDGERDFSGIAITNADLQDADLQDADLEGAILGGAVLPDFITEDQLALAKIIHLSPGQTYADAMMEWVDETFMNERLPGFDEGYEMGLDDLVYYLQEYGMDPYGKSGQRIIAHFTEHAVDGWYGDFYRFNYCSRCQEQFRPDYDLDYANQVLNDKVLCPDCLVESE